MALRGYDGGMSRGWRSSPESTGGRKKASQPEGTGFDTFAGDGEGNIRASQDGPGQLETYTWNRFSEGLAQAFGPMLGPTAGVFLVGLLVIGVYNQGTGG